MTTKVKDVMLAPMAKEKQLQVRVSEDMHRKITEAAAARGLSVTTLVMLALRNYVPELGAPSLLDSLIDVNKKRPQ